LSKNGFFVFETRNPNINWIERWSGFTITILSKSGKVVVVSTDSLKQEGEKISFTHHFNFPNESIQSKSTLRFLSSTKINHLLNEAGLKIIEKYGDWDFSPLSKVSLEMIFKITHT
jgi:hypothetical protein